jgi:hypothetical protein
MNWYDTIFFPDTDIFNEKRYPLLLFFTPLYFLRLAEPKAGDNSTVNDESDLFLQNGLCQAHTPAPLGENLQGFLRLTDDIRRRKEHYVAKLKTMTPVSKAASTDTRTADQHHGIITSLLQEYGITYGNTKADLELWQARLVLAIAEMLNADEDALREQLTEQLALYTEEEIAAFRFLQQAQGTQEEDLIDNLDNIEAQLQKPRPSDTVKRFEAWLRLLKNQPLPPVKVWVASTRDSAEQIFNRYEAISGASAMPVLKLALPAYIDASPKYVVQQIEEFQQATTAIHQGLTADFERIVRTVPYRRDAHASLLPYGTDWADQWEGMLDGYFPAARTGRMAVTFYLLPEQPLAQMLSLPEPAGAAPDHAAHGLLGVLGPS